MPTTLVKLGFTKERAEYLAANIVVDPARGSGHALGAGRRGDNPHLRTRVGKDGMDYKGYNIAVHEMGHNVEQMFSLKHIDYYTLQGVPNTAFTEALAFVFQAQDLELLGLAKPTAESRALQDAERFLGHVRDRRRRARRHGGVALDVRPSERHARGAARRGRADLEGHLEPVLRAGLRQARRRAPRRLRAHGRQLSLPARTTRSATSSRSRSRSRWRKPATSARSSSAWPSIGSLTPDLWMKNATGAPVGSAALLHATEKALGVVK